MIVLGIETSCDETSVAIVDDKKNIISNIVLSQLEEHKEFGGVVPEIAARSHINYLHTLTSKVFVESKMSIEDVNGIAVTGGPGLIGGVIVGVMFAKGMALASKKSFIAINHLEGHALTARLIYDIEFPYLLLLVSGGHCQILEVLKVGHYNFLGSTIDDALGEAFDKVAKMLGLDYPGGPIIEKLAQEGNPNAFKLPLPLAKKQNCNFSFSGLKTAVKRIIDKQEIVDEKFKRDLSASFQFTALQILCSRLKHAFRIYDSKHSKDKKLVMAGGVAANNYLRSHLEQFASTHGYTLFTPPINLCTDNAAMIAWAGLERLRLGLTNSLDFEPRSRWAL